MPGSSPQARGTQPISAMSLSTQRLIPAGAGNTTSSSASTQARSAHPRRRGEHMRIVPPWTATTGSSPQARGTQRLGILRHPQRRLIPAGAGNTSRPGGTVMAQTAHPRRRGEHWRRQVEPPRRVGSSPQARGTLAQEAAHPRRNRLIPAGAGNTCRCRQQRGCSSAHPRRRGEHLGTLARMRCLFGSSPQARGTRQHSRTRSTMPRLIPAGAGNTLTGAYLPDADLAHPRRRGEHASVDWMTPLSLGSSPQARGTLQGHAVPVHVARLIPAGAGNTSPRWRPIRCQTAHPRRRGEHKAMKCGNASSSGSSPQARGTRP